MHSNSRKRDRNDKQDNSKLWKQGLEVMWVVLFEFDVSTFTVVTMTAVNQIFSHNSTSVYGIKNDFVSMLILRKHLRYPVVVFWAVISCFIQVYQSTLASFSTDQHGLCFWILWFRFLFLPALLLLFAFILFFFLLLFAINKPILHIWKSR